MVKLVTPIRLEPNIFKTAEFRDSVPKNHPSGHVLRGNYRPTQWMRRDFYNKKPSSRSLG